MRRTIVPLWMAAAEGSPVRAFVVLYTLEAFCRALPMALVPLTAHRLLGGAQEVSFAYFLVGVAALGACLLVPMLTRFLRRRGIMTLGAALYLVAAGCYTWATPETLIIGLISQMVGAACLEISMSLYVMDHVPRQELGDFEPKRMLMAGGAFIVGPWAGVELAALGGPILPFGLLAVTAVIFISVFWVLRLKDNPAVTQAFQPPPNPLAFLPRFFKQPRLRLAWALALGRTSWWIMFFVYAPIFVTELGFSERVAGMTVTLGTAAMLLMPLWARVAKTWGMRVLLVCGYGIAGLLTLAVFAAAQAEMEWTWLPIAVLVLAGIATTTIDGAGNVPFLRAVHPYERSEMTAVFTTYRQTAQLTMPAAFAWMLTFLPLPSVFVAGGLGFLAMAALASFIPRKM